MYNNVVQNKPKRSTDFFLLWFNLIHLNLDRVTEKAIHDKWKFYKFLVCGIKIDESILIVSWLMNHEPLILTL